MNPTLFGDSHDMAKLQIMQWLAPNERWAASPMWYCERPEMPECAPFLARYSAMLGVDIVAGGESSARCEFLTAAHACNTHLLLDPDTGLNIGRGKIEDNKKVALNEFIQILHSPHRKDRLTLIYDQSYQRNLTKACFLQKLYDKMRCLRAQHVHAVAYLAHINQKVVFIWASTDPSVVTEATRRMQEASMFPYCRFVDVCCEHVLR